MRIYPIVVAVLVVFAGCGGVIGGNSDEPVETFTPAPDPTPKPTPTPVPQLAPGLTGQGIENSYALVTAHTSFLRNHSFTVRTNTTWIAPNGTVLIQSTDVFRVGPPGEGFHSIFKRNGSNDHRNSEALPVYTELWSNGKRVLEKSIYANGTTTYNRLPITAEKFREFLAKGSLDPLRFFGTFNTAVTEQFTQNGTILYRVRGATQTDQQGNITFQLLVDSRGVIHKIRTVRESAFRNITIIHELQFSNIGTTEASERPSWVDEALNQTTPIPEDPRRPYDETANSTDTNGTASKTTSG